MEASPHRAISEDTRAQVSLVLRHSGIQAHTLTFHGTTCNLRDQGRMPLDCAMIQWHGQGKWIPLCFHLGISRENLSSLMSNLLVILSLFHTKNRYSELLDLLPRPLSLIPQLVPKRIYISLQNDMQNAIKWKLTEWGKQERLNNKFQQTHLIWTLTGGGLTSKLMQLLAAHPSLSKGTGTDSLLSSLRQATLPALGPALPPPITGPPPVLPTLCGLHSKGHSSWRPSRLPYSKLVPSAHLITSQPIPPFLFLRLTMPCFLFIAVCPWAVWRNSLWISCSVPRAVPGMQRTHTCKSCKGSELND